MIADFELFEPTTIEEACRLKKEHHAKILAGGTDVLVDLHNGKEFPFIVNIQDIPELSGIEETDDAMILGALTRHHDIEFSEFFRKNFTALQEGCSQVGSPQIRELGSLGGNICNAVPSADSIGPMLVYDTKCIIASPDGEREVPLCEFFVGPKKTVLGEDEILKSLVIPKPEPGTGSRYIKYGRRRAMDLALCGVSVLVTLGKDDAITKARVSLTTSAPTPIRSYTGEAFLLGKHPDDVDREAFGKSVIEDAKPRSSWRSSAEFRMELLQELSIRAFETAVIRAKEGVE